jgi:hypothetical protein
LQTIAVSLFDQVDYKKRDNADRQAGRVEGLADEGSKLLLTKQLMTPYKFKKKKK